MDRETHAKRRQGPDEAAPDLLSQLRQLYGAAAAQRDVFGRREAMPSEVERALRASRRENQTRGERTSGLPGNQ